MCELRIDLKISNVLIKQFIIFKSEVHVLWCGVIKYLWHGVVDYTSVIIPKLKFVLVKDSGVYVRPTWKNKPTGCTADKMIDNKTMIGRKLELHISKVENGMYLTKRVSFIL